MSTAEILKYHNESHVRRYSPGGVLRFYECLGEWVVQQVGNVGRLDGRLKKSNREWRRVLFRSSDRQAAVSFFNSELNKLRELSGLPVLSQ